MASKYLRRVFLRVNDEPIACENYKRMLPL